LQDKEPDNTVIVVQETPASPIVKGKNRDKKLIKICSTLIDGAQLIAIN
jgi:hypothetical protein